jgi:CubicO group peptidase (beta-lactamase class C family)
MAVVETARRVPRFGLAVCGGLILALAGRLDAAAAEGSAPAPQKGAVAPASAAPAMTAADVEAFLDGLVPAQLAREDIAGAVVVVVNDGKVLFEKGYGWADVEKKKPVSPAETLFRPGSTSKLFTWTAVMQLVEQGKLDLDKDVNEYLDFKIPEKFGKPITLRDAMTHTPGFEDSAKDLFVGSSAELEPLGKYLASHIPARIFPPGAVPAYSNYATALAGYIVERVSGKPFATYVDESIYQPLGMTRSTFEQPLPKDLAPLMSEGYRLGSGKAKHFELINPAPAGAMSGTGSDMARFMIAHLQDGQFGDRQILRPETAKLMHARQRGWKEPSLAMALGFYEESRNGKRIIGHAGDTMYFHTDLHLIPEARVGFFVSYNSGGRAEESPRTYLWDAFVDRYFPYMPPAATPSMSAAEDIRAVSGPYLISRRSDSAFVRLVYLLTEPSVTPVSDQKDTLQISLLKNANGQPKRWRSIAPMTFREVDGQDVVMFRRGPAGRMQMKLPYPFFEFERPTWFEDKRLLVPIAIVTLVVLILALFLWPTGALVRRHYRKSLTLERPEGRLRLFTRLVVALNLLVVLGFAIFIIRGFEDITMFTARGDAFLRVLQILGYLAVAGTLIVLFNMVRSWASRERRVWSKLGETLIAGGCLGFVFLVLVGHLLHVGPLY